MRLKQRATAKSLEQQPRAPKLVVARSPDRKWPDLRAASQQRSLVIWLGVGTVVVLLIAAGWYESRPGRGDKLTAQAGLGLNVERTGRSLRLTWNRYSAAFRYVQQGTLWITDGGIEKRVSLDRRELSQGSVMYAPVSDRVGFRLEVRGGGKPISDFILSLAPASGLGPFPDLDASLPPLPLSSADRPVPQRRAELRPRRSSTPNPAATADPLSAIASPPAAPVAAGTPTEVAKAEPVPAPEPVPPATFERLPLPSVNITYEAAPEPAIRKGLGKIPGLRLLPPFRRKGGENFAPAKPVQPVKPRVPMAIASALPGEWRVDLKAHIDKSGRVSDLDLLSSGVDDRMVSLAKGAVHSWEFKPAQLNDSPVSSQLIVSFHFHNPPREIP